jgi:hypothetical protein
MSKDERDRLRRTLTDLLHSTLTILEEQQSYKVGRRPELPDEQDEINGMVQRLRNITTMLDNLDSKEPMKPNLDVPRGSIGVLDSGSTAARPVAGSFVPPINTRGSNPDT